MGAYYNSKDGSQHAIIGTRDAQLIELYWKSGQGRIDQLHEWF